MLKSKLTSFVLMSLLALSGCQSVPVALPELPQEIQKREPNLTQRLLTTLSPSQQTATKPSSN